MNPLTAELIDTMVDRGFSKDVIVAVSVLLQFEEELTVEITDWIKRDETVTLEQIQILALNYQENSD